ncbi:hypothetical protein RRG08_047312 [Elysia crispata]|uniref:Uncharacterized protein n=1 Tax=Elysia crispata TaxID=231223 RepID=A0AAE1CVD0_9GAST|nr:hypothetical protein RRG08_047312 [Elysia crispata]
MEGYFIVSDYEKRTLHLIDQNGVWIKKLWTHPGGEDTNDELLAVSLLGRHFVCSTAKGTVFVMDVL